MFLLEEGIMSKKYDDMVGEIRSYTNDCRFISENTNVYLSEVCIVKNKVFYNGTPSIEDCERWLRLIADNYTGEDMKWLLSMQK